MKAVVMYPAAATPKFTNLPEPVVKHQNELLVNVKAVAIKNFDKARATGTHYSENKTGSEARIVGGDGICLLDNGMRVYGVGTTGMLAQKALINKNMLVEIPENLDDATAAALPNGVIGSAMALKFKAQIKYGNTVLINGATGFTGRIAIQVAKHYGAGKIIATGRNQLSLENLKNLGADVVIQITENKQAFAQQVADIHLQTPVDIVIDYLWGNTAEIILDTVKGNGASTNNIRFVSVGSMSGETISLSSSWLRGTNLQLTGSGLGSWTKEEIKLLFTDILPEMFGLAAAGKLAIETTTITLHEVDRIWDAEVGAGQRLVVLLD